MKECIQKFAEALCVYVRVEAGVGKTDWGGAKGNPSSSYKYFISWLWWWLCGVNICQNSLDYALNTGAFYFMLLY